MEFIWMVGMEEPFAWTAGVLELGLSMLESEVITHIILSTISFMLRMVKVTKFKL